MNKIYWKKPIQSLLVRNSDLGDNLIMFMCDCAKSSSPQFSLCVKQEAGHSESVLYIGFDFHPCAKD